MPIERPVSQLAQEYEHLSRLFAAQPPMTQHFLDQQAGVITAALEQNGRPIRFQLPDQIILEGGESLTLAPTARKRSISGGSKRHERFIQYLNSLEQSLNPALTVCGKLFRYALARHIIYHFIPDGLNVRYQPESGDDIPSIPVGEAQPAALLARTDAVAEFELAGSDDGMLQVPYVAAARRFYLPQWVAFGEGDQLLTNSFEEAEACMASLKKSVRLLQDALDICPSLVADQTYQRKRAGLLGQLVNQGRALARAHTRMIIEKIRLRATAGTLNRGLRLSLPFFDDNDLTIQTYPVEIIPNGRIMFVPAFVTRAVQLTEAQIRYDSRLGPSTRRHLLTQLRSIKSAFNGHSSQ